MRLAEPTTTIAASTTSASKSGGTSLRKSLSSASSSSSSSVYPEMNFNNFINAHSPSSPLTSTSNGNYFNNERDGKKYKLRLKFDGACALEVVRLNGGHFQVGWIKNKTSASCNLAMKLWKIIMLCKFETKNNTKQAYTL